ncbi:tape measure protein [Rhodoferax sp.]|uniref:tape measure protein n=1 Tax=Rhodoferax sp. TaxID=50421 RepID=UPI00262E58F1|nr:tape measure protein [Rhodoferax sp.]MDD5479645.1 tape measure protein [Rhodoferax sp.]
MNEVKLKFAIEGGQVVSATIDGVTTRLDKLDQGARAASVGAGTLKTELSSMHLISKTVIGSLSGIAGGLSVVAVAAKAISVQREFDVLNSSLITVTGSSMKAAQEFEWIKRFAATTPYQLNEVTGAFVKMKALGLDASEKALTSYGNTASAMGKGINQMIEAVADASTGEFERLKEFGIKAKQNGDQVSLTFQGVTTSIGNNAAEITQYLQQIGDGEFAGAMQERAKTLDGAISNLADNWDELFRTVNQNAIGPVIYDSVTLASKAISDAITVVNSMSSAAAANAKATGAMATVQEALATTFETVAVLGVNVKYVLTQVGDEIGGVAARAVQILQGNFAGAAAIRSSMVADAKAARVEIDATTTRILGARAAVTAAASVNATASARLARQGVVDADITVAANDKVATSVQKVSAVQKEANRIMLANAAAHTKVVDAAIAADEKAHQLVNDQIKTGRTLLEQIEFETQLLSMNTEQRAIATVERELERQGIVKGTLAYDAYIEQLRKAVSIKAEKESGIKAADDLAKANQTAAEASGKYWEDALMRAFESGKGFFESLWDTIKNTLKTQILKVSIQGVMGGLGVGAAGAATAGESGGNLLGTAGNLSSLYNTVSGGLNLASTAGTYIATNATNLTLGQFGAGMMNTSSMAAAQAAAQAGGAQAAGLVVGSFANGIAGYGISKALSGGYELGSVNTIAGIASMIPGVGPLAGVVGGIVNRAFGSGPLEMTGQGTRGTFGADGFTGTNYANFHRDGGWFSGDTDTTDYSPIDTATNQAWSDAFAGVKTSMSGMATTLGHATTSITAYAKAVDIAAGTTAEQMTAIFTGMADDMAVATAPGITALAKVGETASVTMSRLATSFTTANAWLGRLQDTLFDVGLAGADSASKLADAFGGLDALSASSKAYYDLFYTDAERLAQTSTDVAKGLALVNVTMPGTKDAFRSVVTGLDLTTDAGRNAYAVMLALAPEFATVADAAAAAVKTLTAALTDTAKTGADDAMSALERAVDAQRLIYQAQADAAESAVSELQGIFDTLDSSIKTLYGQVDSAQSAATGRAFIDTALSTAQATGYLPDGADLSAAISAAVGDATVYATQAESDFQKLALAGTLGSLKTLSGDQLTTAEKQLALSKDQLTRLDDTLSLAQQQLDAANGINTSVLSVADAVANLASSLSLFDRTSAAVAAGGTVPLPENASTIYAGMGDDIRTIQDLYSVNLGRVADPEGLANWTAQFMGDGVIDAAEKQTFALAAMPEYKAKYGFAVGINRVPYDMTARIHADEAVVPAAFNPFNPNARQNGIGGNTERLEALVEVLVKTNERLETRLAAIEGSSQRTADATNGRGEMAMLMEAV